MKGHSQSNGMLRIHSKKPSNRYFEHNVDGELDERGCEGRPHRKVNGERQEQAHDALVVWFAECHKVLSATINRNGPPPLSDVESKTRN
jgi:hypothetical protein